MGGGMLATAAEVSQINGKYHQVYNAHMYEDNRNMWIILNWKQGCIQWKICLGGGISADITREREKKGKSEMKDERDNGKIEVKRVKPGQKGCVRGKYYEQEDIFSSNSNLLGID
jgi:hypothetical protein